jgi:DNA-binding MarR family transcriptional regulator
MDEASRREAAIRGVMDAQLALVQAIAREQLPEWTHLDLTMGQLKTLMALSSHDSMTVSALAEALNVGKPTASLLVDRLVQLGYVARAEDREDRRRTLVTLSATGSDLTRNLRQGKLERFTRWLAEMDTDDLVALQQGLRALAAVVEREAASVAAAAS